jgi:hypothetical protein
MLRVQAWLDSVAEKDAAEALRLWLALLRYVTPTLQAAAIADLTPRSTTERLASMTNGELMRVIVRQDNLWTSLPLRQSSTGA